MIKLRLVELVALNLIKQAVVYLPGDVKQALKKACQEETNATAKTQLETILRNIAMAEESEVPICQDTGTLNFYIKAGVNFRDLGKIEDALLEATRKATREIPLRPNAVDPFTQKNSGDNTGRFTPHVSWEIVTGDSLELTVMPKGGGSENVTATRMLLPSDGVKEIKKFVIEAVIRAGARPCPPTILGVAIGGSVEVVLDLAKKNLLKPLSETNPDPTIARLEQELLEAANMTGIGPMGLGGETTVLGVHVDYAHRHPASFPVAVAFNCWAARRASARITSAGKVQYQTH